MNNEDTNDIGEATTDHVSLLELTREMVMNDRRFRVQASYSGDDLVAIRFSSRSIADRHPHQLQGTIPISDVLPASKALASLLGAVAVALEQGKAMKGFDVDEVRRHHPNAYRSWTTDEEARLRDRYHAGLSIPELAREFGRRPGGIGRRLERLGLIEPSDIEPVPNRDSDEPG